MHTHLPNDLLWTEVDRLGDFATKHPTGVWSVNRIEHAPDDVEPVWRNLTMLRIPPTLPWRMEQCVEIADGQALNPEVVRAVPGGWAVMLQAGHDYAQDLTCLVTMWVDTSHGWVYAMIGSDVLCTRRWMHPALRPPGDRLWDKQAHFDYPMLTSIWHSFSTDDEPDMGDLL